MEPSGVHPIRVRGQALAQHVQHPIVLTLCSTVGKTLGDSRNLDCVGNTQPFSAGS